MAKYFLKISDGREHETEVEAASDHDALNIGLNALSKFACRHFPPPENLSIRISDAAREHVGTLRFEFSIEYAPGVVQ